MPGTANVVADYHYPAEWERNLVLNDDWRVFARPVRPTDEALIHDLLKHVTPQDLRLRFFGAMKHFTHQFLDRLTNLDYARAMAFIAIDKRTSEALGVVRLHLDPSLKSGEYAVLVRSKLKGRGLGWALMELIIEFAESKGLESIHGQILQENSVMLAMCKELGFEIRTDPDDRDLCDVELSFKRRDLGSGHCV